MKYEEIKSPSTIRSLRELKESTEKYKTKRGQVLLAGSPNPKAFKVGELLKAYVDPDDIILVGYKEEDRSITILSLNSPDRLLKKIKRDKGEFPEGTLIEWHFKRCYYDPTKSVDRLYKKYYSLLLEKGFFERGEETCLKMKELPQIFLPSGENWGGIRYLSSGKILLKERELMGNITPPETLRDIFRKIDFSSFDSFCDLGTSIGIPILIAGTEFGVEALGIECRKGPVDYFSNEILPSLRGMKNLEKAKIVFADFFEVSISADVIYISLSNYSPENIERLTRKIGEETKAGNLIISMTRQLRRAKKYGLELINREWYPVDFGAVQFYFYKKKEKEI